MNDLTKDQGLNRIFLGIYKEITKIKEELNKKFNKEDYGNHLKEHKELAHKTKVVSQITNSDYVLLNTKDGELVKATVDKVNRTTNRRIIQIVPVKELLEN